MTIYYFADALTVVVEAFMIFILLETFFTKRGSFPVWTYIAGIGILTILLGISNIIFNFSLLNACGMVLSVFLVSLMYKGSLTAKMIVSVLSILFIAVVEIIVMFFITLIFNIKVEEAVHIQEYRLLGIIVSKVSALAVFNIIRVNISNTSKQDSSNHGLGLVNLKETLSNYNSEPVIETTKNEFILKFVLFTK